MNEPHSFTNTFYYVGPSKEDFDKLRKEVKEVKDCLVKIGEILEKLGRVDAASER